MLVYSKPEEHGIGTASNKKDASFFITVDWIFNIVFPESMHPGSLERILL